MYLAYMQCIRDFTVWGEGGACKACICGTLLQSGPRKGHFSASSYMCFLYMCRGWVLKGRSVHWWWAWLKLSSNCHGQNRHSSKNNDGDLYLALLCCWNSYANQACCHCKDSQGGFLWFCPQTFILLWSFLYFVFSAMLTDHSVNLVNSNGCRLGSI